MPGRRWLIAAAALLVVGGLLLALPVLLRWMVTRQATALTGEPAVLADLDVNLFTRRLALIGFALGDESRQPVARFDRLDASFQLLPLLRGHLRLSSATLREPRITVVRAPDGRVNLTPVLDRLTAGPARRWLDLTIEHGTIRGGRLVFHDRGIVPARTWEATDIEVELHDVTTLAETADGSASATFMLAGAPARIGADELRLRPFATRARLTVSGLELAPLGLYLGPDAPVRLTGGRVTGRWSVEYGATGLQGDGRATVEGLVLERADQPGPFIAAPAVVMRSQNARYRDGAVTVEHFELSADPTVTVEHRGVRRQYAVAALQAVLQDVGYPASTPGRATVTARLPAGGALDARGQVALSPLAADLRLTLRDVAIRHARPYLPADMPVTIDRGRLRTALDVRYAAQSGLLVNGRLAFRNLVLLRRGQKAPFITHRELTARVRGLSLGETGLAVERVVLAGAPRIVDGSFSPPQRFDTRAVSLTVERVTVPSRGPARLRGRATLDGGATARLAGRMDFSTLMVDATLTASGIDLTRLARYLGSDPPVALQRGALDTRLRLSHDPASGIVTVAGQGAVTALAIGRPGQAEPLLTMPRLALGVERLRVGEAGMTARRLTAEGAPVLHETAGAPARQVRLRWAQVLLSDLTWPGHRPAAARLHVELPEAGALRADGSLDLDAGRFRATIEVEDAALGPYRAFLPVSAPVSGRLHASLLVEGALTGDPLRGAGTASAHDLALGPPEQPTIAVAAIEVTGLDARWPERVEVERLVIHQPSALVEREPGGEFPLLAMLGASRSEYPAASPRTESQPLQGATAFPAPDVAVAEIALLGGQARFVDRGTRPFYSEELTSLEMRVEGLRSDDGAADVTIQGILGTDAALELRGVVAPLGEPFFLEVTGALRQFQVSRTNPLLLRFLETTARSGELSTELHYRITGDQLQGTNRILVQRLDIERSGDDRVSRAIGLPLALVVSLLKNPAGDIRLTIPVEGELGSPQFSFGDSILAVLRNAVTRLATAPLRAIGRIFQRGDDGEADIEIEPATFAPGSAAVTPDASRHLQRVADVLRAAPFVRLGLQPVLSAADLEALRLQEAAAEVQRLQREAGVIDFPTAARRLYRARYPDREPPEDLDAIMAGLAARTDVPAGATQALADRRAQAVQRILTEDAGIDAGRLELRSATPEATPGAPRVTFELLPSG